MLKNVGTKDRVIRLVIAAVFAYLAFGTAFAATGFLHWLFILLAIIMVVTAIVGTCPIYRVLGKNTCNM